MIVLFTITHQDEHDIRGGKNIPKQCTLPDRAALGKHLAALFG